MLLGAGGPPTGAILPDMRIRPRSIALGLGIGWAVAVLITLTRMGDPADAWCYYGTDPAHFYVPGHCFLYSPPIALATNAIRALMSFEVFAFVLRLAELTVLIVVTGPAVGLALFIPAVAIELNAANINLLVVGAVLIGFRHPWAWAFVVLTKVTPGIGLLWFAVRREWRNLAIAVGTTAAIAATSWLIAPDLWQQYLPILFSAPDTSIWLIAWRLPLAAIVVVWGARTDRRWAMIVALFLALPRWYFLSPVVLVGLFPLVRFPPMDHWRDRFRPRPRQPATATAGSSEGRTKAAPSS
jgi:hypothetical protein